MSGDAEMRKRFVKEKNFNTHIAETSIDDGDSEDDSQLDENHVKELTKVLPQSSDKTTEALDSALASLQPRWRNGIVRGIFSVLMIAGFIFIIYLGPLALLCTTLLVQVKCFQEIISVGYAVYRIRDLPRFHSLSWYLLLAANYYFYGDGLAYYFGILLSNVDLMQSVIAYHHFISFTFYIIGFVWFVLSLVKKYYMKQFSLFAWTHVGLLIVVTQSYLILQNLFKGLIWFIVPVSMIICNDMMAYVFGFFFGKTPLIKLSPKKTWEGFIGGGISTVIFGAIISNVFCYYDHFVCPFEYSGSVGVNCTRSSLFLPVEYNVPSSISFAFEMVGLPKSMVLFPFVLHSLSLSLFSSIVGPFGGFFASGFKRAFKVKDFGDIIPGHGGIVDRFDCQFLMASFVFAYIDSFIKAPDAQKLLNQIYLLKSEEQFAIFYSLNETLFTRAAL